MIMMLTEFLLARIAEDLADLEGACWDGEAEWWMPDWLTRSRLQDDLEAKRRILEEARDYSPELSSGDNGEWAFDTVLRALASVYADHPDYREEWRP